MADATESGASYAKIVAELEYIRKRAAEIEVGVTALIAERTELVKTIKTMGAGIRELEQQLAAKQ